MTPKQPASRQRHRVGRALALTLCLAPAMLARPALAQDQCVVKSLDIDGDGEADALTDGILILRHLFGFGGALLVTGAVDIDHCTRCTAAPIQAHIATLLFDLEVDADGDLDALTDGILILRHLFGFNGPNLVNSAVDLADCKRCTSLAIEVYLESLEETMAETLDVWEPTTVPYDPDCPGCVEVEQTDLLPHLGLEISYLYDEAIDDPIAQWGDCLKSMLDCLMEDNGVSACAAAAACPAECKSLYASRAPEGADEPTLLQVLNGVYIDCGAPCRPVEEVEP